MGLLIAPLPIFGLVVTGIIVSAILAVHIWRSRIDRRRNAIIARDLDSADHSFVEGYGLRGREVFRGSPIGGAPSRSTRALRERTMRDGELDLGDLRVGAVGNNGERPSYFMSGGRDGASDDNANNPFATPTNTVTTQNDGTTSGTWYTPNGDAPPRRSASAAANPATTAIHYDCDLATNSPDRLPYCTSRANNRSGSAGGGKNGASPLRFGVTVSTVIEDDDPHDIANAKPAGVTDGEDRGRSHCRKSNVGRSVSRVLAERRDKRSASRETLHPLEVHPWRLSYT